MTPFRILVTGSRLWTDRVRIAYALLHVLAHHVPTGPAVLVHGDAYGADKSAEKCWAALRNDTGRDLTVERHRAEWTCYGRAAGHRRNAQMVALGADICLAFPLGESRGTRGCMALAEKAGIPVISYELKEFP